MSDFPEEEPDPEMAADDEENAPGLVELLEEIVENEEREELEGLAEPDVEFDLETEPVTMNEDPYDHSTMPSLSDTTSFTKVPNVEIVGEQIPAQKICSICIQDLPS